MQVKTPAIQLNPAQSNLVFWPLHSSVAASPPCTAIANFGVRPCPPATKNLWLAPALETIQPIRMNFSQIPVCLAFLASVQCLVGENWPCWRGPRGDGTSREQTVPIHWNGASNVVWKTALPGFGHASPIVWEDRIFTVAAL